LSIADRLPINRWRTSQDLDDAEERWWGYGLPRVGQRIVDGPLGSPDRVKEVVFPTHDDHAPVGQHGGRMVERCVARGERSDLGPGSVGVAARVVRSQTPPV